VSWQGSETAFLREPSPESFFAGPPLVFLSIRAGGYCQSSHNAEGRRTDDETVKNDSMLGEFDYGPYFSGASDNGCATNANGEDNL